MKEVEQYLKSATRGLWGRKHKEVREELEAHIQERVMAYRIAGLGEEDATERTLGELGHPREVSAGMARIYTLPTLFETSLLATAACVLVVSLSSSSLAQSVEGLFYYPTETCVQAVEEGEISIGSLEDYHSDTSDACVMMFDGSLWLSVASLERALEPQGVDVHQDRFLTFDFPKADKVFLASNASDTQYFAEDGELPLAQSSYISLWKLIEAASISRNITIDVAGWNNPTVKFNDTSLQIGTEEQPVKGNDFYGNYLSAVLFGNLVDPFANSGYVYVVNMYNDKTAGASFENAPFRTLQLDATPTSSESSPADVYGVAVVLDSAGPLTRDMADSDDNPGIAFLTDVARVNQEGQLDLHLPAGNVRFVETLSTNPEPGTAVLVRLTGGLEEFQSWYEIISPEQIREVN